MAVAGDLQSLATCASRVEEVGRRGQELDLKMFIEKVVSNTDRAVRISDHLLHALLKRTKKVTANVGQGNIDNANCDNGLKHRS